MSFSTVGFSGVKDSYKSCPTRGRTFLQAGRQAKHVVDASFQTNRQERVVGFVADGADDFAEERF